MMKNRELIIPEAEEKNNAFLFQKKKIFKKIL